MFCLFLLRFFKLLIILLFLSCHTIMIKLDIKNFDHVTTFCSFGEIQIQICLVFEEFHVFLPETSYLVSKVSPWKAAK